MGEELLGMTPCPVYRRRAKLHLILRGGGSDRMEKKRKRVTRRRGMTVIDLIRHVRTCLGKMGWGMGR